MTTYTTVRQGLFYMVDLSGFTSHLARADNNELQEYGKVLYDEFFVPIAKETITICKRAPVATPNDRPDVRCSLVNTPGDAAILVFTCRTMPFDYLVDKLIDMTSNLKVHLPGTSGENFQLKFGMDVGPFVVCGKPFMGGPGFDITGSTEMSFIPTFIIGDVINRLARMISSPVDTPHAPRISAGLFEQMSSSFRESKKVKPDKIQNYPEKDSNDQHFYVLQHVGPG